MLKVGLNLRELHLDSLKSLLSLFFVPFFYICAKDGRSTAIVLRKLKRRSALSLHLETTNREKCEANILITQLVMPFAFNVSIMHDLSDGRLCNRNVEGNFPNYFRLLTLHATETRDILDPADDINYLS